MTRLAILVATFGYVGYAPVAPGTAGSAAGLAVYALLGPIRSPAVELAAIVVLGIAGVWAGSVAERVFAKKDPSPAVVDEVVGMLITVALLDVGWMGALVGFFLFRFFDVVKPYPSRALERLPGGAGVMADDAVAAVYAHLALRAALWVTGWE